MGAGNEPARAGCFASAGFTPAARTSIVTSRGPGGVTLYDVSSKVDGPVATQRSAMPETLVRRPTPPERLARLPLLRRRPLVAPLVVERVGGDAGPGVLARRLPGGPDLVLARI